MSIVVLDSITLGEDLDLSPLKDLGETVTIFKETKPEEIIEHIGDHNIVITNKIKLMEDTLCSCPNVKLICVAATGYDNIDTIYCKNHGIAVCNVAGYSTESVTQMTFSIALYLYSHMQAYSSYVASGEYSQSHCFNKLTPVYHELYGKTWGIIGLGTIGTRVADVASAFGMKVLAYTRTKKDSYPCVPLKELLSNSDIVSIHTPLNDGTRNLISTKELSLLKPDALLINMARGAVVDERAVADALMQNKIYFGCDVYSKEPFEASHPYAQIEALDRVCLTPHMAWGSYEARVRCFNEIIENIKYFKENKQRNRIV